MCEYLIPSLRSKDWKADPTIQVKIDEQMKKAHFRKIVANLQKKVKDQKSSSSSNSSNEAEISSNATYTAGFARHNTLHLKKSYSTNSRILMINLSLSTNLLQYFQQTLIHLNLIHMV